MSSTLLEAIYDSGLRWPNFFNGRILTAQVLKTQQESFRTEIRTLVRSLGSGIIEGLWVEETHKREISITSGLALTPRGDILAFKPEKGMAGVTLRLSESVPVMSKKSIFDECEQIVVTSNPTGSYLLLIESVERSSLEQASFSGVSVQTANCQLSSHQQVGAQFKLLHLNEAMYDSAEVPESQSLYRSWLAHQMLGVIPAWKAMLGAEDQIPNTLIDHLRENGCINDRQIPMAIINLDAGKIKFVDVWSVRRPVYLRNDMGPGLQLPTNLAQFIQFGNPDLAVAQAAFFSQFQAQLADIHAVEENLGKTSNDVKASDYFTYLPSAGYFPFYCAADWLRNFFLNDKLSLPREIDAAYVRELFHQANFIRPMPVLKNNKPVPLNVDLFKIPGSNHYLFKRKEEISIPFDAKPGALVVGVFQELNELALLENIESLSLSPVDNPNQVYVGRPFGHPLLDYLSGSLANKVDTKMKATLNKFASDQDVDWGIFAFTSLPKGDYLIELKVKNGPTQNKKTYIYPNLVQYHGLLLQPDEDPVEDGSLVILFGIERSGQRSYDKLEDVIYSAEMVSATREKEVFPATKYADIDSPSEDINEATLEMLGSISPNILSVNAFLNLRPALFVAQDIPANQKYNLRLRVRINELLDRLHLYGPFLSEEDIRIKIVINNDEMQLDFSLDYFQEYSITMIGNRIDTMQIIFFSKSTLSPWGEN